MGIETVSWIALFASGAISVAALADYLRNRLAVNAYLDIIKTALENNQQKLVMKTSEMLMDKIIPNVNVSEIEANIIRYLINNHQKELIAAIAEAVAEKAKYNCTDSTEGDGG